MTSEVKTKLNIPLAIFIVILSIAMYALPGGGITVGGFTIEYKYLLGLVIVIAGLFCALIRADLPFIKRTIGDSNILFLPYFIALLISIVIWSINLSGFRIITKGIASTLYQLLAVFVAWANVIMFREKAAYVQIIATIGGFIIYIIQYGIIPYGFSSFATGYISLVTTFTATTTEVMKAVEYHHLVYFFAVFIVYFAICEKKKSERIIWGLICLFAFSLALKRIAVLAIVIAVLVVLICKLFPENARGGVVRFFGILMFLLFFAYVVVVKQGLFDILMLKLGVDTMGRVELFEYVDRYYEISPRFTGYGLGFIERMMETFTTKGYSPGAIHNDILRMYIELGFFGFIIWMISSWIVKPSFFTRKRNAYTGVVCLGIYVFCFIIYATDNTLYYYYTNIGVSIAVLSCANHIDNTGEELRIKN